jgi:outer membrane protein OmpA-like peptidoglycan-associated protein
MLLRSIRLNLARALVVAGAALMLAACQTPPSVAAAYAGPTLEIEQSERGVQIFLPSSILFASGQTTFDGDKAAPYLDRVASLLKTKTTRNASIEGHTDNVGTMALNQTLSDQRALALRQALIERGVATERLQSEGFAFKRPVASNGNEEGRSLNRRVELVVLDEKIENITRGEPAGAFASAWDKLRGMVERGLIQMPESK